MASLDNLQPDQRAVLQMVLQRGRSYDEIANLLGIDRGAVRQRALDALDALTPMAVIPGPERALVTDYLLGQLPAMVAEQVLGYLEASESDREWGLALSRVLQPLAPGDMPEIPLGAPLGADGSRGGAPPQDSEAAQADHEADALWPAEPELRVAADSPPEPEQPVVPDSPSVVDSPLAAESPVERDSPAEPDPSAPSVTTPAVRTAPTVRASQRERERQRREAASAPGRGSPASIGHLWLWGGLTVAILAVVVVVVVLTSGSSSPGHSNHTVTSPAPTSTHTTPTSTQTTPTGTRTTPTATHTTPELQRLALLHLSSPAGAPGTTGVAQVVRDHGVDSVVITAQGMPANTAHDAYAVWLSNSLADSLLIGWVPNVVGRSGLLSTEGTLPARADRYHHVLITLETQAKPTEPGEVVLSGLFREHS